MPLAQDQSLNLLAGSPALYHCTTDASLKLFTLDTPIISSYARYNHNNMQNLLGYLECRYKEYFHYIQSYLLTLWKTLFGALKRRAGEREELMMRRSWMMLRSCFTHCCFVSKHDACNKQNSVM